jgi:organic hydroperoxide reductase OsmC/OhrA
MAKPHTYSLALHWTGAEKGPTTSYDAYSRDYVIEAPGKAAIQGSSEPAFRGDAARTNPEEMLLASLSACHMLWYLHLCAEAGVHVVGYEDTPFGAMNPVAPGGGRMTEVVLHPKVTIALGHDEALARSLHEPAHAKCFIANSVNFPVTCQPSILIV